MHPSYQRRGVGRALLARAIADADAAQRSIFIRDSSPAGFPLYVAHGFRQVDAVSFSYKGIDVVLPSLMRGYDSREGGAEIAAGGGEREGEAGVPVQPVLEKNRDVDASARSEEHEHEDAVLVSPGMVSDAWSDGSEEYVSVSPGQLQRSP